MKFLIIGLGIYGANLALDLTQMGHEVIGADIRPSIIESIKDRISTAYIIDSTDETALDLLPLKNVDIVIVAIGENFGASVKTVAILKKSGVKHIFARAIDELHEAILQGFNIDRIVTPEQRAAHDLVSEMQLDSRMEALRVDDKTFLMKFDVPSFLTGMTYGELNLENKFKLKLISVTRPKTKKNIIGGDTKKQIPIFHVGEPDDKIDNQIVTKGDRLITLGTFDAYRNLSRSIQG